MELEVVVVDDGSPVGYEVPDGLGLEVKVVRLPRKFEVKNPCVCWNAGVATSSGDLIGLSSVEMLHRMDVLGPMVEELGRLGERGYVMASCREENSERWHCHSTTAGRRVDGVRMPGWSNYHFMSLMGRGLWEEVGGFDEGYRDGYCFDDADFVRRLDAIGVVGVTLDEVWVEHPRGDAKVYGDRRLWDRNRALFRSKWGVEALAA
jgi:hypothetical protein